MDEPWTPPAPKSPAIPNDNVNLNVKSPKRLLPLRSLCLGDLDFSESKIPVSAAQEQYLKGSPRHRSGANAGAVATAKPRKDIAHSKDVLAAVPLGQAGQGRALRKRRRRASTEPGPTPRRADVLAGWNVLLGEISASDRRVRGARGGHLRAAGDYANMHPQRLSPSPEEAPGPVSARERRSQQVASPRKGSKSTSPPPLPACDGHSRLPIGSDEVWPSYRISPEKVPEQILDAFWEQASQPRREGLAVVEVVAPMDPVPRLTVTRRTVQPLPQLMDFSEWQQANRRRREQEKLKLEAERHPTLQEMMASFFGAPRLPGPACVEAQLRHRTAAEESASVSTGPVLLLEKRKAAIVRQGSFPNMELHDIPESELAAEVERVCRDEWTELQEVEAATAAELGPRWIGNLHSGRRGGLDDGGPLARFSGEAAIERRRERARRRVRSARLFRGLEAARAAARAALDGDEEAIEENLRKVVTAGKKAREVCTRKVEQMQDDFLRRKGHLSVHLQWRVKRLQLDHQEIYEMKARTVLPSPVAGNLPSLTAAQKEPGGNSAAAAASAPKRGTVLQYLRPHRQLVEHDRRLQHAAYLKQVESFQGYLRLLADPNRPAERGEVYLSRSFKYVLAGGLLVDEEYFFRVLDHMEPEDFEKVPTVNLVAACCVAFGVNIQRYWGFLETKPAPKFQPAASGKERELIEYAPWNGVKIEPVHSGPEDLPFLQKDPLPFAPIVPEITPPSSELVSREDPLTDILKVAALNDVLCLYELGKRVEESAPPQDEEEDEEDEEPIVEPHEGSRGSLSLRSTDRRWRSKEVMKPLKPAFKAQGTTSGFPRRAVQLRISSGSRPSSTLGGTEPAL